MIETRKMKMNKRSERYVLNGDIIEQEILSRLPVKSLLRFKSVCKRWHSWISDPIFISKHSLNFKASPGLVYWGIKGLTFLSSDQTLVVAPETLFQRNFYPLILASCNGLLCGFHPRYGIWLCNLVTKEMISISNPAKRHLIGLAFDPYAPAPRYHIICPYRTCSSTYTHHSSSHSEQGFDVFSSDTQVWRQSKEKIMLPRQSWPMHRSLFIGGVLYFMGTSVVIWFNPEKDLAGVTPLPTDCNDFAKIVIGEWEGRLSYIQITDTEIDIWVMSYSQWRKRYCVKLERMIEQNAAVFAPICYTLNLRSLNGTYILLRGLHIFPLSFNGCDIILLRDGGRIFSYNLKTGEASEFHRFGDQYASYDFVPYKNSFFALPKQRSG